MVPGSGSRGCAEGPEQSWGVGTEGRARELLVPSRNKQENSYHVLKGLEKAREHLSSGIPVRLNRATQTSSISVSWEHVKHGDSQVPPQTY